MEKRHCRECNEEMMGRIDKQFCSDQCRSLHNNKLNSSHLKLVGSINRILSKNRRIMERLNPSGKTKIHKKKLADKGFNFSYFTSTYKTKKGSTYYYNYDHGYLEIDNDYYILVKDNTK